MLHPFAALCNTEQEKIALSGENMVTKDTPPTFMWMTSEDPLVSVTNCLMYSTALKANGVKFELHIFPEGRHGLALANEETSCGRDAMCVPHVSGWIDLAIRWAREL